jgi:hypothetical protein
MKVIPGLAVAGRNIPVRSPTMVWFTLGVDCGLNLDDWSKVRNPDIAICRIVEYLDAGSIGIACDRINNARAWIAQIIERIEKGEPRISVSLPYDNLCNQARAMNTIFTVMGWLNVPFRIVTLTER